MNNDNQAQVPQAQQQPADGLLSLDDDTPMACPLRQPGDEGACEACQ